MTDIGYLAAFLGGALALLSPCSALLLPAFFAYSLSTPGRLVARTGVFYLGLATTLVPLGAASTAASRLFNGHRELLIALGGWIVIAMGLAQILGLGFASRRAQAAAARITPVGGLHVSARLRLRPGRLLRGADPRGGADGDRGQRLTGVRRLDARRLRAGHGAAAVRAGVVVGPLQARHPGLAARPGIHPRKAAAAHHLAAVRSVLHRHRRAVPALQRDQCAARGSRRGRRIPGRGMGDADRQRRTGLRPDRGGRAGRRGGAGPYCPSAGEEAKDDGAKPQDGAEQSRSGAE